jgi:glycosyltransferase involved in cell wall biosynthesis
MRNSLNILHISPNFNYICGVSKYVYLILKELKKYEKSEDLKLFFLTNGGDSLERLKNIGIKTHLINFSKGLKNLFYVNDNLKQLEKFCIENEINIIHTHHRYPEFLSNIIKRENQIKTITTVHSIVKGFKFLSFKSDKIIAVSKAVEKNLIEKFNIDKGKIIQIYNPIAFDDYIEDKTDKEKKTIIGVPDDSKIFLFVGRWTKLKGVDILINAFSQIFEKYDNVYLILITDVPDVVKNKILKISSKFIFIRPQRDISYYYKICDAVVLPSRVESFPYTMLEAGLHRKLFIGTNLGGISEFIENEKNGLLFENGRVDQFVNLVSSVIQSSNELQKLRQNLFEKISYLSRPEKYCSQLIEIYRSLQ